MDSSSLPGESAQTKEIGRRKPELVEGDIKNDLG
jgi:hypothetical protein